MQQQLILKQMEMIKKHQIEEESNLKNDQSPLGVNKKLIIGSILATIIALTPYLFYLYQSVPETKIWNTFLFTYDSKAYQDASYAMWILLQKSIPLLLLLIWFFTCRHWWYHVIIAPIAMYVYQIVGLFAQDVVYIDGYPLTYLLIIMLITVPSIYLLRAKMFNKINDVSKTMEELEEEFKIKPKSFLDKFSDYF